MSTNNIIKKKINHLNDLNHTEIGDDHLYTSIETPLKKDAFKISDEEKKNRISMLFEEIMF